MTVIDIKDFGGVLPSVRPRDLTDPYAQVATNLDLRFQDFRPTKVVGVSLTAVASAAKSVFRTPINGTWLSSASDVDYTPNLIQDVTTERVYLTGRSGYPEAWEYSGGGGAYRQLGVPTPTTAPTFTVAEVFQFSAEDALQYRLEAIKTYVAAINNNLTRSSAGYAGTAPTALGDGAYWLPHGTSTSPALPTSDSRMGCFCVPVTTSGSSYTVNSPKHLFVVNPALNGKLVVYAGTTYLATPMYANGATYVFGTSGFSTAVRAILHPQTSSQLFPDPAIAALAAEHGAMFDPAASPAAEMIADMDQYVEQAILYLNPASGEMLKQAIANFYTTLQASGGAIDKAADNLANTLYEMASAVWSTAADSPFATGDIPSDVVAFVNPT